MHLAPLPLRPAISAPLPPSLSSLRATFASFLSWPMCLHLAHLLPNIASALPVLLLHRHCRLPYVAVSYFSPSIHSPSPLPSSSSPQLRYHLSVLHARYTRRPPPPCNLGHRAFLSSPLSLPLGSSTDARVFNDNLIMASESSSFWPLVLPSAYRCSRSVLKNDLKCFVISLLRPLISVPVPFHSLARGGVLSIRAVDHVIPLVSS
ncbi:hypothetical protein EDB85DRAFT_1963131 [Lactarius pseudohatsudake]|nr:hypothetical protein EDB85DRAFT_1963131 [Lactarius pseudohatsudake]